MRRYTIIAILFPVAIAACFTNWSCGNSDPLLHKRQLLEFTYMPIVNDSTKETGSVHGYTVNAIYLDGKDTVSVTGLTQTQYDNLQISE